MVFVITVYMFREKLSSGNRHWDALSLFSGIGGFEAGMSKAGIGFVRELEADPLCCQTLNANLALLGTDEDAVAPADICQIPPEAFCGKDIGLIVGGPPCQSFSAAGRRTGGVAGSDDPRGTLFERYCLYVRHFKPKAFVFENVKGILSAKGGKDFSEICSAFSDAGYRLFKSVLNAAGFGVPQFRERLFLVGVRKDLDVNFRFPKPIFGESIPFVTAGQALAGVKSREVPKALDGKYGHLLPDIPPGENYSFYTEEMGHQNPQFAWRSRFSSFLYKMDPDAPCKTLTARPGKFDGPLHWENRHCSIDELKALQGFPAGFSIPHPYRDAVRQIGNSVCPPVAEAVGRALNLQFGMNAEEGIPLAEGECLSVQSRPKRTARHIGKASGGNGAFEMERSGNGVSEVWKMEGGRLEIRLDCPEDPVTELEALFIGKASESVSSARILLGRKLRPNETVSILWDRLEEAVAEFTPYAGLKQMYGTFAEPHPKFSIRFKSEDQAESILIQKAVLDESLRNRLLPIEKFPLPDPDEALLERARSIGFDIRSKAVKPRMPEGFFRIAYPFPCRS